MLRKHSDENDPADWFYLAADRLKAADILWRQAATGEVCVWYMNGATITQGVYITTIPPPWQIAAASTGELASRILNSVSIMPANPSLPLYNQRQFTAIGTYADKSV